MATESSSSINIQALLESGAWSRYQKLMLALISLAYLTDGIANQSLGLAIPALMRDWALPREAFATVAAVGLFGLAIGSVIGGVLGDRHGRRTLLVASTLVFGLMTAAQAWATNPTQLLTLRFLDGLGIGAMIPNGAAMLTEFTPRRYRPLALSIGMTFVGGGSMVAGLIGNAIIEPMGASGLFLVLGALAVVTSILLLALLPESPVYLAQQGKQQDKLRRIALRCGLPVDSRSILAAAPQASTTSRTTLSELFKPDVASSTVLVWIALFFCLLANYAMISWVPAMLAGLGFALSYTSLGMTAQAAGGLVGGIASGWLIRQFGTRRSVPWLAAGGAIGAIALGMLIQRGALGLTPMLLMLGTIGFFIAGLLNGCYTLAAFIYPDNVRGTGVGTAAAAGRFGAIASSYAGVMALSIGGAQGYFLLIAVAMFIGMLAVASLKKQIPAAS